MTITPEQVKDFWAFMQKEYGSKVVQKDDSLTMKAAAELLNALGIQDKETFMKTFTTTLYETIYIPFELGVEEPGGHYTLWSQIRVCVHEHQHIVQGNRDGWPVFASRYLASSSYRAGYEAEAFGSDMEMEYWKTKQIIDIPSRAAILKSYGCSTTDIDMTVSMLKIRATMVSHGTVLNPTSLAAIKWLDEHVPGLRSPDLPA